MDCAILFPSTVNIPTLQGKIHHISICERNCEAIICCTITCLYQIWLKLEVIGMNSMALNFDIGHTILNAELYEV